MSEYAKRIGVVCRLQQRIEDPSAATNFDSLYSAIGLNTGNFMFINAVYRQIDGDLAKVGFDFKPEKINKDFDALVVPAANWINERTDWNCLIDLLEKIDIPIITIGIGLQADSIDLNRVRVNDSSMRLIKLLSGKSKWISCRGDFTKKWLASVGVNNVITTGCPSIYMEFENKDSKYSDSGSVILQGTRYWLSSEFINSNNVNRKIFSIAGQLNLPIIYQSEPEEIDYLVYSGADRDAYAKQKMPALAKLYGFLQEEEVEQYLTAKGRLFFDVDQWSSYVKANMGVIGTRLHGAIIALNSGKPARLISHDSRTQEVADFAGIPSLSEIELNEITDKRLAIILNNTDISGYLEKKKINAVIYRQFLEESGLRPNYSGIVSS